MSSWRTTIRAAGGGDALVEALLHRGDDLVEGQAAADVLLGGVADLGVDHAVGGQVLDALAGDPVTAGAVCMTATVWSKVSR